MFKRQLTGIVKTRLREKRRLMQVLLGPRQVGKTTAIQQVLSEADMPAHYAAADLPAPPPTGWIEEQWRLARMRAAGSKPAVLVLDEVQKIAHWSDEVKRLWDEDTRIGCHLHVVLLGSSALLVQKGLKESLAGRFEVIRCLHWSWPECREAFGWSLDQYLFFGGYPGAAPLIREESRWGQYVRDALIETAISKDVLLLNRVEKPVLLRQLFVLACEYAGEILSYQKMLGQLQEAGNTTTLAHYQELLESAFLIRGLQKWSGNRLRRRSSSPKWIPLNTALITALSNRAFEDWRRSGLDWGRLVEAAVGAHLVNQGWVEGTDVYYWRQGNEEVDFVLRRGDKIAAFEVKSGRGIKTRPGLASFSKGHKGIRAFTVGGPGLDLRTFFETPLAEWFK